MEHLGKKDAGQQEMIEKAALSPLLAPLTPEEFAEADMKVSVSVSHESTFRRQGSASHNLARADRTLLIAGHPSARPPHHGTYDHHLHVSRLRT